MQLLRDNLTVNAWHLQKSCCATDGCIDFWCVLVRTPILTLRALLPSLLSLSLVRFACLWSK